MCLLCNFLHFYYLQISSTAIPLTPFQSICSLTQQTMLYARILHSPEIWVMRIMQAHHAVRTFLSPEALKSLLTKFSS